ncbi:HEAT repeat-containing protein [Singulisphaera sp. GP187]|uniref:HEAT repeat domain-containing protein n=1 Tax=Singulisphaera sp. GP187 TaxID=1882752 RepID=UPI00092929EE|nr:HEAT repeat domain-containing protein [Singulisphaera sp. GP187]SIO19724.1 HEAT repeat-containing protein [Singulisphaera sp. GP187]
MSIAFQCERCGKDFVVGNELAGKRCKCKQCGHVFAIPNDRPASGFAPATSRESDDNAAAPRRAPSSRPKSSARAFARDGDPYDFDDEPWQKQPSTSDEPDLDELLPQRPKPAARKRSRHTNSGLSNFATIPFWVFLLGAFFGFAIARQIWMRHAAELNPAWIALAFVAYTLSISGAIGCLVVAFREGPSYGLCCSFMPLYILYYVFSRWEHTKEAFFVSFTGGMLLSGASAIDPDIFNLLVDEPKPKVAGAPENHWPPERPGFARPPAPWRPAGPGPNFPHPMPMPTPTPPVAPAQPRVVLGDFTDQALADLKSPNPHFRKMALGRLKNAPPNDRRDEIAKAVEPLLTDPDGFCRSDAAKTLAVWGGVDSTPALLKVLKDPAFNVRWAILDALKELRDPKAAEALIDYLMTSNDRGKAAEALKAIGPSAEEAVLRGLTHHDGFARMDVCRILQAIGTLKSVPALQDVVINGQGHGLDVMAARDALKQIELRNSR